MYPCSEYQRGNIFLWMLSILNPPYRVVPLASNSHGNLDVETLDIPFRYTQKVSEISVLSFLVRLVHPCFLAKSPPAGEKPVQLSTSPESPIEPC